MQKPDTDFEPNLVNTVCFLVQWVVQLTTFAVNYMGHPFNTSLEENGGMAIALRWGAIGFVLACLNIIPYTDWALSLVRVSSFHVIFQRCSWAHKAYQSHALHTSSCILLLSAHSWSQPVCLSIIY